MKKIKGLLYCPKAKPKLYKQFSRYDEEGKMQGVVYHCVKALGGFTLNGTIVAECDFEVEEICSEKLDVGVGYEPLFYTETIDDISKGSCLTQFEIENYLGCKEGGEVVGYALHISNLKIFDKPRELYDCLIHPKIEPRYYGCEHLSKAPKNMMYVELDDIKYILISIQPQWLCKILNGEQTILINKKVLNCMKGNE